MTDRYKESIQGARDCVERNKDGGVYLPDLLVVIDRQQAEIERLTINMNAFGLGMKQEKERADTIKAEAIKEFTRECRQIAFDRLYIRIDEINNLEKEFAKGK